MNFLTTNNNKGEVMSEQLNHKRFVEKCAYHGYDPKNILSSALINDIGIFRNVRPIRANQSILVQNKRSATK